MTGGIGGAPRFVFDISTPEKKRAAYLKCFEFLDKDVDAYQLEAPKPWVGGYTAWQALYDQPDKSYFRTALAQYRRAKKGNWRAAKTLISRTIHEVEVEDPLPVSSNSKTHVS